MRCLPLLVALFTLPAVAQDENARLRAEVEELRTRVAELERQLASVLERVGTPEETASIDSPSSKVTKPRIGIGGRVKVDAVLNSRSASGPGGTSRADTAFFPAMIPLSGEGESAQLSASARESRFWIDSVLPTRLGDLTSYLEVDFASADGSGNERVSNSHNLRLRHAYAKLGGFTIGQTYTTFLDVPAYPETNDANGPVGILFNRQPLLRYEKATSYGNWKIAIEQPETTLGDASGRRIAVDDDRIPDLVARVDFGQGLGSWSVSSLLRQIRADGIIPGREDTAWGYGVSVSGRLYLRELDNLRFSLATGEGLGRYVAFNTFAAGSLDARGEIELTPVTAAFASYQHWWNSEWRSNWTLGAARADIDDTRFPASTTEKIYSSHLNLLWSPLPEATVGIEWLFGKRDQLDGRSGIMNRIQFTSVYNFSR